MPCLQSGLISLGFLDEILYLFKYLLRAFHMYILFYSVILIIFCQNYRLQNYASCNFPTSYSSQHYIRKFHSAAFNQSHQYMFSFHKRTGSKFDFHRAVHRNIIPVVKPTRCTNVSNLFYFEVSNRYCCLLASKQTAVSV